MDSYSTIQSAWLSQTVKLKEQYSQAQPFPHVVIDNFLPEDALNEAILAYPPLDQELNWRVGDETYQLNKRGFSEIEKLGTPLRNLLLFMNSGPVLKFLEELTGIQNLLPDPYYIGGGLHQIGRGGFLKMHTDFMVHPKFQMKRRINLLIYLNQNWKEEYGGHLELWNSDLSQCEHRILPTANRCVIFNTTRTSFHGHPEPLTCPEGMTRKSVSFYYYTLPEATKVAPEEYFSQFHPRPNEKFTAGIPGLAPTEKPTATWLRNPVTWKLNYWRKKILSKPKLAQN